MRKMATMGEIQSHDAIMWLKEGCVNLKVGRWARKWLHIHCHASTKALTVVSTNVQHSTARPSLIHLFAWHYVAKNLIAVTSCWTSQDDSNQSLGFWTNIDRTSPFLRVQVKSSQCTLLAQPLYHVNKPATDTSKLNSSLIPSMQTRLGWMSSQQCICVAIQTLSNFITQEEEKRTHSLPP